MRRLFLGGLVAVCAAHQEATAEFSLLPPSQDATLIESPAGVLANGSGSAIFAGRISAREGSVRRASIAFDIGAAIPAGSTVTGAALWLNLSGTNAGPVQVRLHRLLAAWSEGTSVSSGGGGAPARPGDVTWIHRSYDDVPWATPGGDFDPVARAATLVDQPGIYVWGSTSGIVRDIQDWLDRPDTNFGWLLVGDESRSTTVKRFDSRENEDQANRPLLEIDYIPPCAPDPRGPGYWKRQCASLAGVADAGDRGRGSSPGLEPGLEDWILPCAQRTLARLGLDRIDACGAVLPEPPLACEERAAGKLAVLVLDVCAGRLQTSCAVPRDGSGDDGCAASSIGDLMREIADRILAADCRGAWGCAGATD